MDFLRHDFKSSVRLNKGIFESNINGQTTVEVTNFYDQSPFPNFNNFQNKQELLKIIETNSFLKDLKDCIGLNKSFLEVGSGTCQLSLALATGTNNSIVAMDPTKASLKLGKEFAEKNMIKNVSFLNADIFDDPCKDNYFDYVWCSGVLHHTMDSKKGFEIISKWVKPGGLVILGLYNTIGRLRTNFRQTIYNLSGRTKTGEKIVRFLDPYLRNNLSKEKDLAWFRDQYEHPVERKHSIDEVLRWFDENEIDFLGSLPSANGDGEYKKIHEMNGDKGSAIERFFSQVDMLFSTSGSEGGLFICIGKRKEK